MLESLVIFGLLVGAIAYVGYRVWRGWHPPDAGCHKGCGCETSVKKSA